MSTNLRKVGEKGLSQRVNEAMKSAQREFWWRYEELSILGLNQGGSADIVGSVHSAGLVLDCAPLFSRPKPVKQSNAPKTIPANKRRGDDLENEKVKVAKVGYITSRLELIVKS